MTTPYIQALAKQLYDAGIHRPYSPAWEQLGDVTRSVWYEKATDQSIRDDEEPEGTTPPTPSE